MCVCVCQTYKQNQVSTVSREYDVLSMTFLDHCALPFSYYILRYGVHAMIIIVWEPWMMAVSGFECMIDVESGETG